MNEEIMRKAGFGKEMDAVAKGKCPFCGTTKFVFRDPLSLKEWQISGLCQKCQDKTFRAPEEEE